MSFGLILNIPVRQFIVHDSSLSFSLLRRSAAVRSDSASTECRSRVDNEPCSHFDCCRSLLGLLGIGDTYYPGLGNGGYDVQHYDLGSRLPTLMVRSRRDVVTHSSFATQNLSRFNLDFVGWDIDELTVDGIESGPFRRDGDELVIHPYEIPSVASTSRSRSPTTAFAGTDAIGSTSRSILGWLVGPER